MFDVDRLISPHRTIVPLEATNSHDAIIELVKVAEDDGIVTASRSMLRALFERERHRHTIVTEGIAFPRAAARGVSEPFLSLGRFKSPVVWSERHAPVSVVVLYGWPAPRNVEFLKSMIFISKNLFPPLNRDILTTARSAADLYSKAYRLLAD